MAEHRRQQLLQRREQRQEAKRKTAAAGKDQLQTIMLNSSKRVCSDEKYGEVQLPPGVLQKVMGYLAAMEADGVRGPSVAVSDLANAALVSWDFYNAAKHGLTSLMQQAAALTMTNDTFIFQRPGVQPPKMLLQLPLLPAADGWTWQQWAAVLQDPLQYKVAELKQAARQLRIPGNSSKAVLVVEILKAFGLQAPSSVAPQLLRAVLLERCYEHPWIGCEVLGRAWMRLLGLEPSKMCQRWPGLASLVRRPQKTSAAERRSALHKFADARSKKQLQQIIDEVQEWQERDRWAAEVRRRQEFQSAVEAGRVGM